MSKVNSKRALLLNCDYVPLHFIDEIEAIYLLYLEKAEMVTMMTGKPSSWPEGHGLVNGGVFPAGATLRLFTRADKKYKAPQYRKNVIFNRDNWTCQYCGHALTSTTATIDHIIPQSRGGESSWTNCTTACQYCNRKKRNRTPEEAGMSLMSTPTTPKQIHFWSRRTADWHPDWDYFLKNLIIN